jgi:hypothetical protein
VVSRRLWKSLSNIGQVLEHNNVAVVFDGFRDEFASDGGDVLFPPCFTETGPATLLRLYRRQICTSEDG